MVYYTVIGMEHINVLVLYKDAIVVISLFFPPFLLGGAEKRLWGQRKPSSTRLNKKARLAMDRRILLERCKA